MKKANTTTEEKKPYLNDEIADMAMRASISTLKKIYLTTYDNKVKELYFGLVEDVQKINNAFYAVSESKQGYKVSDGYDCFLVAYSYLKARIDEGKTADTMENRTMKNGEAKEKTVFQWACSEVRQYIYRNGQKEYKRLYVEDIKKGDKDGNQESEAEAIDRVYFQVGRYYDIDNLHGYRVQQNIARACEGLTERQKLILHYRLQGFGVSEIAEKLGVSQPAISKHLLKIQERVTEAFPEAVRGFKEKREKKAN